MNSLEKSPKNKYQFFRKTSKNNLMQDGKANGNNDI